MSYYRNSPEMLWVSRAGIMKGHQSVLDEFNKDFADRTRMGTYSYESLHIEKISGNSVYFVIRWNCFKWTKNNGHSFFSNLEKNCLQMGDYG